MAICRMLNSPKLITRTAAREEGPNPKIFNDQRNCYIWGTWKRRSNKISIDE
jgi:hypothetical protein